MPSTMLFKDLLDNSKDQDPKLFELWKTVLNTYLADPNRKETEVRKLFEERTSQSVTNDEVQI